MCSRTALGAALLAAAALNAAEAQRGADARRVDAVVAQWRRAYSALKAYDDSVRRERVHMDTIRVGSMRLYVEPQLHARAEAAARVAWSAVDSATGPAAQRLSQEWLIVRQLRDTTPDSLVVAVAPKSEGSEQMQLWGKPDDATLANWIRTDAMKLIASGLDRPFKQWLYSEAVSPDTLATVMWTILRLDVVSSYSTVAQACYRGDVPACSIALGLTEVPDPVTAWYDAPGRRRVVTAALERQHLESRRGTVDEELCIGGDDAACSRAIRSWSGTRYCGGCTHGVPDPVRSGSRQALVKVAMRIGGRDAYWRLLSATGTPAQRIATTAGVPVDSVIRVWRANVHDTRLPSDDFSVKIAAASTLWIVVLGFLSVRSSRWR